MNLNAIYKELSELRIDERNAAEIERNLAAITQLASVVAAAETALRALSQVASQSADNSIKALLAAELALRNHPHFTRSSTEPGSLLNTVIQKRRDVELALFEQTQKKAQRKSDLGGFAKQEKNRKTRLDQATVDETFAPSQFEEVDEAESAMSWQLKSRMREEKRRRREQRAEVLKEMQDRLRKPTTPTSSTLDDEGAMSPAALFEQIKRQLRFVPKKSHAWACALLGIPEDASPDFAKSKYRERARLWHPDMSTATEKATMTEAMAWLNEAWKIFRQKR